MVTTVEQRRLAGMGLVGAAFLAGGLIIYAATKPAPAHIEFLGHTWLSNYGNTYTFEQGSLHTSVTEWRNPTTSDLTYMVMLRFNNTEMWEVPHTMFLAVGASTVHERVTVMDIPPGNYRVYLDVYIEGNPIATFEVEPVTIVSVAVPMVEFAPVTWDSVTFDPGSTHVAHITVINPSTVDWDYTIRIQLAGKTVGTWMSVPVPAGGQVTEDLMVTMPNVEGTYPFTAEVWERTTIAYIGLFTLDVVTVTAPPMEPSIELVSHEWLSGGVFHLVGARSARWTENGWR